MANLITRMASMTYGDCMEAVCRVIVFMEIFMVKLVWSRGFHGKKKLDKSNYETRPPPY